MELNSFLKDLILEARQDTIIQNKNSTEAKEIQAMFAKPSQITCLWFKNLNKIDVQAFYITHNPNMKDLEIYIIGPLQLNSNQKYNLFEKYLTKEELFRWVDFQDDFEHYLKDFIDILRKLKFNFIHYELNENKQYSFNYGKLKHNIFFMSSIKKLHSRKITTPLSRLKKYIKRSEDFREMDPPPIESDIEYYVGWQIDLDMWIGPKLQYDLNDRIEGKQIKDFIKCEINTTYRNQKLEIDSDGYCRLYFGEKKPTKSQKNQIIQNINDLLAIFLINEYDLPQIPLEDISLWTLSNKKYPPTQNKAYMRPINSFMNYPYPEEVKEFRHQYCDEVDFSKHYFISKEKILEMINSANIINKDTELHTMIKLLQESYTYFDEKRYSTSYILSWALIEQFICQIWKDELESSQQSNNFELESYAENTVGISEKIHDLKIWGKITKEQEKKLKKIVRSRNKFLHELTPVKRDLANEVFYGALMGIQSKIKKFLIK